MKEHKNSPKISGKMVGREVSSLSNSLGQIHLRFLNESISWVVMDVKTADMVGWLDKRLRRAMNAMRQTKAPDQVAGVQLLAQCPVCESWSIGASRFLTPLFKSYGRRGKDAYQRGTWQEWDFSCCFAKIEVTVRLRKIYNTAADKIRKVILWGKRLYAIGRYEVSLCGLVVHKCVDPSRPTSMLGPSG